MSAILKQKLIDIANGFTKYGLWKGGGSGNLSGLDDVTLTNLQSNDVLTYNGSVWINDDNLQKQIDTLNSNLSLRPYMKSYYSGSVKQISITLTEKSRYGMLIFGGANGNSFFGVIDIESEGGYVCHVFLNGQLQGISVSNNGNIVTLSGLPEWGQYTVISPYKIL